MVKAATISTEQNALHVDMVSTHKRIFIIIFVSVVLFFSLRILWNCHMPISTNHHFYNMTDRASVKVVVTVFYEALCPDSKYFLTKQVLPTYKVAERIMEVRLAPYGKARTNQINDRITFDCQHGPTECQANIYHACTVEIIDDPLLRLQVVSCMITDNYLPQNAMHKCSVQHNVEFDAIQKCFDSKQGLDLLKLNGEATQSLRPSVKFIPTITIDGFQGRQAAILKDLFSEVCRAAGDSEEAKNICKTINYY
ncbi:gamma-interferon-inducible lysosomal thiol reductase isoform X2 [Drosophila eugracilis]|uniref:gamma-interferon-inducible lysosomal thiol reductase isoform X2 n=1 Tax=Drosophila eugracilis TaxID=29029 RepID=UPI001BD93BA3|nr:gamma-interferon-inducible lysosomal thiol reductase isoform X2 [Drosophila eugracilis]